jgi:hypothetical protein
VVKAFDAAPWHQLVTVIARSGFWTQKGRMMFEYWKWLVDGCEDGTFHSLLLYPEGDRRMDDVAEFVAASAK